MRGKTFIAGVLVSGLALTALGSMKRSLPAGDWPKIVSQMISIRLDKKPWGQTYAKGAIGARMKILTPWAQVIEAAQAADTKGETLTREEAERIIQTKTLLVRTLVTSDFAPNPFQVHAFFRFKGGLNVVHAIKETSRMLPQGSEYGTYITETESSFDLDELDRASALGTMNLKDSVAVNIAAGVQPEIHIEYKDLE